MHLSKWAEYYGWNITKYGTICIKLTWKNAFTTLWILKRYTNLWAQYASFLQMNTAVPPSEKPQSHCLILPLACSHPPFYSKQMFPARSSSFTCLDYLPTPVAKCAEAFNTVTQLAAFLDFFNTHMHNRTLNTHTELFQLKQLSRVV